MRHSAIVLILTGALALTSAALARDLTFPKMNGEQLKSVCDKAGGKFSPDAKGVGCGTNCQGGPGTDCTVYCPAEQKCTAQVIGGRRPRSVAEALTKPERHRR